MNIKAGTKTIEVVGIYAETAVVDDKQTRAMRVKLSRALTATELTALISNDWQLYNGTTLEGTVEGYNNLAQNNLLFTRASSEDTDKLSRLAAENSELRAALDAAQIATAAAESAVAEIAAAASMETVKTETISEETTSTDTVAAPAETESAS